MRVMILAVGLLSLFSGPATARRSQPSISSLEARWLDLNDQCAGSYHPSEAVCNEAERIRSALERRGICWSYSDWRVTNAEYRFHPCSQPRPPGFKPKFG